MVIGILAIIKITVKSGLLWNRLSNNIPEKRPKNITISVRPATHTTVKVTALRNSSCLCFLEPFMAAKLYQSPIKPSRTGIALHEWLD